MPTLIWSVMNAVSPDTKGWAVEPYEADIEVPAAVIGQAETYGFGTENPDIYLVVGPDFSDAPEFTGEIACWGEEATEAEWMAVQRATGNTVMLYESNADDVFIGRADEVWGLGPVTPYLEGKFGVDASEWLANDWRPSWCPSEDNGQVGPVDREGLTPVAEFAPTTLPPSRPGGSPTPAAAIMLLVDRERIGGAARAYIGEGAEYDIIEKEN